MCDSWVKVSESESVNLGNIDKYKKENMGPRHRKNPLPGP